MFKLYKKANRNDYGLIIAAVLLLLIFNLSFLYYVQNKQRDIERHHAQSLANNFSRILNEEMKNSLSLTTTLKEVVLSHDGKVTNFNETSADLLKNSSAIRALQLAPAGKVTYIYPLKGNEAGKIDLLKDPVRAPLAKYAISHKTTVIQGPTTLKQGGKGLISSSGRQFLSKRSSGASPSPLSRFRRFLPVLIKTSAPLATTTS